VLFLYSCPQLAEADMGALSDGTGFDPLQKSAVQIFALRKALLDHLVGGGQQRFRDGDANRLGTIEVDDQIDLRNLLDRQIGWFVALENAAHIDASLVQYRADAAARAYQAVGQGVLTDWVHRGQRMAGHQRRESFHVPGVQITGADQDRTNALFPRHHSVQILTYKLVFKTILKVTVTSNSLFRRK
jgi:hypothetical protein